MLTENNQANLTLLKWSKKSNLDWFAFITLDCLVPTFLLFVQPTHLNYLAAFQKHLPVARICLRNLNLIHINITITYFITYT